MIDANKILLEYRVTEKASELTANLNQYTFEVAGSAGRKQVRQAVEQTFGVSVARVNILNVKPKFTLDRTRRQNTGRKSGYKKAIVTLKEGETIEMV